MENIISDTKIFHINRSKAENVADSIMYYDKHGKPQQIDLDICAENYPKEHNRASAICVGERDITKGYFLLYTSGIKTRIVFKRKYVWNFGKFHLLSGSKNKRFLKLQSLLQQTKYTTRDLS